jgi:membrane protein implicated in regulation of membrane protease activity
MTGNPRLLVLMTFGTFFVLGGIVALATGSWWALLIAVAVHAIGTLIVMSGVFKRLDQGEKPDPVVEARLEDEGAHRAG